MSATVPTQAEIVAVATELAPELTAVLADSAAVVARLPWCRALAGWAAFGDDYLTTALAYLLAHRCSKDLAATQGSSSAPIGGGLTGAVTSVSTGGMSIGYGASGAMGAASAPGIVDAELALTTYGQAFLALRDTRAVVVVPFCG